MVRKLIILVAAVFVGGCAQLRPMPAPGCALTAYRLLPSPLDPQLAAAAPAGAADLGNAITRRLARGGLKAATGGNRQVLVLSGGGEHGAFGAGLLHGLPSVPDYDVVTGISTGSLQSTFAFLANRPVPKDRVYPAFMAADPSLGAPGTSQLGDLRLAYAISREGDLMKVGSNPAAHAVLKGSVADFSPLRATLSGLISHDTIRQVAAEGAGGRSLFVGVVDLDDGYGYAIDLTALAEQAVRADTIDAARGCYVDALIASSSVPPGVPPVTLPTDKDGGRHDLYMDGGARFGVFFEQLRNSSGLRGHADLTLIVNGGLYDGSWGADGKPVPTWSLITFPLRAVSIMENQVYRLSVADAESWGAANGTLHMAFSADENLHVLTNPPGEWPFRGETCDAAANDDAARHPVEFHPKYMRCLIDYAEHRGATEPWNKSVGSGPTRH